MEYINDYQRGMVNKFPDHHRMVVLPSNIMSEMQKEYDFNKAFTYIKVDINIFIGISKQSTILIY
jgi:hypothetical protein